MKHLWAVVIAAGFAACSTLSALAGTTGGINGRVVDADSGAPVAGVKVTADSPSQIESTTTDASGRYAFVSLSPDTYTIGVSKGGYDNASIAGIVVFADAQQTVGLKIHRALKTIANVRSRSASDLVRPGTTADVYSVNAAQQARVAALGGGMNLDSAYSAIASVPGAYVPANQSGYLQAVHVRGGDSYEVGYEFDGVPVNRAFDNYPSGSISSLGQQELQVYTGATPASAEAQGLAGFINQVIKTGTYPGFGTATLGLGTPSFYHSLNVEAGGASPNRLFSYYVGLGGYNAEHRYVDQFNGESYANEFGPILDSCPNHVHAGSPPSCFTDGKPNVGIAGSPGYILGPLAYGGYAPGDLTVRTDVVNLHFGLPHHHDSGRDDIQLLYDVDSIYTALYNSALDEGLINFQGSTYGKGVYPYYLDYYQYYGPTGALLPSNYASLVKPYFFPSSPTNRDMFAPIPLDQRDVGYNDQDIVKLQYQKNFSANAYLRLYGYTYYSDYIGTGPVSSWQPYTGLDSGDYIVGSHTRGVSAQFAAQLGSQHLLQAQASYTTATSTRVYNEQMFEYADNFAVLVNPNDLTSGTCYALRKHSSVAVPTTCMDPYGYLPIGKPATFVSLYNAGSGAGIPNIAGATCGGAPCAFYVEGNGQYGEYNNVKPIFTGYSLTDQWHPNDRLAINLGLRLDRYVFEGADTNTGAARDFWFDAFNKDVCFDNQSLVLYDKTSLPTGAIPVTAPCSTAGKQYVPANMQNASAQTYTYNILQPRFGITYTVSPDTVLRASYGKYNEQPSAAYEQYNALQQNLPDTMVQFYALGFNTPGHAVSPPISYNADFSIEHHFKGTDLSLKFTPFLRQTHDEIENFYTNIKAGFISGLNAGNQTSEGFELALNKGDFTRNGFAGQLSFAYTNTYVRYNTLPNGKSILSPINADIQQYNAYTSYCTMHPSNVAGNICYTGVGTAADTTNGLPAAPCYTTAGAPVKACAKGDIANPYWNAPPQQLLDPSGNYLPYSTDPGGIGSGANAYNYPYVATLILNYKHDRLSITPSFQFMAGNRYGAPETMPGIDPAAGCSALAGHIAGDPRYPYGARGGSPYDAATCAGNLDAIPDSFTGNFDAIGAFRQPAQLLGHLRISYDVTPKVTATFTLANLLSTCFGGQQTGFTYLWNRNVCSYGTLVNSVSPVGNVYNPRDNVQTFQRYPYEPSFAVYNDLTSSLNTAFTAYFQVQIKL